MDGICIKSSVEDLIEDIRELNCKSRANSFRDVSCEMLNEKLSGCSAVTRRESAVENAAGTSKQLVEAFKKRSFVEQIIERSKTAATEDAPNSCGLRTSLVKKWRNGEIPKIFNAPGTLLAHALGEIALQLEKRIILHVYPESESVYYGSLQDIREVIASEPDPDVRMRRIRRLQCCVHRLQPLGWDMNYDVAFGDHVMRRYGVGAPPWLYDEPNPLVTHAQLARIVCKCSQQKERLRMMTILNCLLCFALDDGRPLFLTCEANHFDTLSSS